MRGLPKPPEEQARPAAGKLQPVDNPAAGVQRQHAPAVLANQLLLADRWGQPCLAYNVFVRPGLVAAAALGALQARALRVQPSLLQVPKSALHIPGSGSAGDLAHITLFRYAGPLHDPASLLRWLAATQLSLHIGVSELLVIREQTFPSLDYQILHRLPLAPTCPAASP